MASGRKWNKSLIFKAVSCSECDLWVLVCQERMMVGSWKNWRRRCGIPATPSPRNRSTSSSSWLGKILQGEQICCFLVNRTLSFKDNKQQKPQMWNSEDASQIIFFFIFIFFTTLYRYFKLHILLALTHSLILFHIFSLSFSNFPNPPPLQVCGYVCAGSRLQQFSSAAQSAHERCGSLQETSHWYGTSHILTHSHTPHAAGRLHTLVKLSRFILINGRHLQAKKNNSNLFGYLSNSETNVTV